MAVSGCIIEPKTIVSLKNKALETLDPTDNGNSETDNGNGNGNGNGAIVSSLLSVDNNKFCITQADGNRLCWGEDILYAQKETFSAATSVLKNKTIKKISVSTNHSCAIGSDDKIYCWGEGEKGQLGQGLLENSSIPVAVNTTGALNGKVMVDVYVHGENTCAVDDNSFVYCWGDGKYGQLGDGGAIDVNRTSAVPVLIDMTLIAGKTIKQFVNEGSAACILASDNNAYCWGVNFVGNLGNGTTTHSTFPVQVLMPGALTIKQLGDSGGGASCALASDDNVYCWGYGGYRLSDMSNRSTPQIEVGALTETIKSFYMGKNNVCVITASDAGYCWGRGASGAIGNNNISNQDAALVTPVGSLAAGFKSFSIGDENICAIALDESLYCWGKGTNGQLGNGANVDSRIPVLVDSTGVLNSKIITKLQIERERVCALATDNEIYCWGLGAAGTIGDGVNNSSNVPVILNKTDSLVGKTFKSLTGSSDDSTCAIASNDKVYCWGEGIYSVLGSGRMASQYTPTEVYSHNISNELITNVIYSKFNGHDGVCLQRSNGDVYCGENSSAMIYQFSLGSQLIKELFYNDVSDSQCFIDDNDLVYCWGKAESIMGNIVISKSSTPRPIDFTGVLNNKTIKKLVMGYQQACVLASDNQVYCWGEGDYLGNGIGTLSLVPTAIDMSGVLSGLEMTSLFIKSEGGMCVIANNERVYCWGYDTGNGDTSGNPVLSPVEVTLPVGVKIKKYSAGIFTTYLLTDDGEVYSWGDGTSGELGNGASLDSFSPVLVSKPAALASKKFLELSSGDGHTCAVADDSQVYCWGYGADGNLGNNSISDSNVPVAVTTSGVMSNKSILAISSLWSSTCALDAENNVYCWGAGPLGNNTNTSSLIPVEVLYAP